MAYRSRYAPPPSPRRPRTSRWRIFLPSLVLLLLFAGLGVFWAFMTWRAGHEIDRMLVREAAHGRDWTCPNRTIGGFPFRIEISCDKPSFAGEARGRSWRGEVERAVAVAQILSPRHIVAEVTGPLAVIDSAGGRLDLSWDLLHGSIEVRPGALASLDRLSIEMTRPKLALVGYGPLDARASGELVDFHLRRAPGRPEAENAFDIASRGTALAVPIADQLLGGEAPVDMDLVATLLQGEQLGSGTPPGNLEAWRRAGGRLQVSRVLLSRGAQRVEGTGMLGLDERHRPQGRLDLSVVGADDLLQHFGLSPKAAQIGGLIAGVLGGRVPKAGQAEAAPRPAGDVALPLRLDDGKVFLGPLPVARLAPLY